MNHLRIVAFVLASSFAFSAYAGQVVDVGVGTVEMPDGFAQTPGHGFDSIVGRITSADGKLNIGYDNGELAGRYAEPEKAKESDTYTEFKVGTFTAAMLVTNNNQQVCISVGLANFFAAVRSKEEIETVKQLALSFKVKPPNLYARDDLFKRTIDGYIAKEQAGNKSYQKDFWLALYRAEVETPDVGWQPSRFKDSAEMVAYIKQRRRERGLPTYDN